MCVLTRRQSVDLKRFIGEQHPRDFVIIADANEVVGKGFKPWKPR
jgi:uncharacterized membrane-anchored protein YitT (DUF2179 family)